MDQLWIFVIALNSASGFFVFVLTDLKVSACRPEERNNRETGKEKSRVLILWVDQIFISNNNCYQRYTNKK